VGFEALLYIYSIFPWKSYVFLMWDLKPINIYTLSSLEKNHGFSMWDKKLFGLNTST